MLQRIARQGTSHFWTGLIVVISIAQSDPYALAEAARKKDEPARAVVHAVPKPLADGAVTSDWPRFLGPFHNGKSPETKLLKHFPTEGPTLIWEMETGSGFAPPAVVADHLVFIHRVGDENIVECLRPQTGERVWSHRYLTDYRDRYGFSNGPRCGPVIEDGRVYTYGAEGKLHCLRLADGEVVWKRDILREFRVPQDFFGVGSSPLVEGDVLIVNVGAPGGPCVVAFDKRSGKEVWRAGDQWGPSYASPVPADVHGERRVFVFAGGDSRPPTGGLLSINPRNGAISFRFPFRGKTYESVNAASPVLADDHVFITSSYGTGGAALKLLTGGGFEEAWRTDALRSHFATPIVHDGYLYGFDGSGRSETSLVCVDMKSGRRMWSTRLSWTDMLDTKRGRREVELGVYRGSLIYADTSFLCLGEMGHLLWLDLSPQGCKEVSRARLFYANESWSPPVLSRGLLYIAQNENDTLSHTPPRLHCYDMRGR